MEKDYEVVSCTEPGLKELSKLITAQPQIENDLVYGRKGESQTKFNVGNNHNKRAPEERFWSEEPYSDNRGPSGESGGTHETKKLVTPSEQGGNGSDRNQGEHCKVCKGHSAIPKCSVFLSIGVG